MARKFGTNKLKSGIKISLLLLTVGFNICSLAQIAGSSSLTILQIPMSARVSALGLDYVPSPQFDFALTLDNPSLIDSKVDRMANIDYMNLFAGVNLASVNYGASFGRMADFVFGLRYYGYGTFEEYDEYEQYVGTFNAGDFLLTVGWGMHIDSLWSLGACFKPVFSHYGEYSALSIAVDVAASYISKNKAFAATVQARNIGSQLVAFNNVVEQTPFTLSAVCSYKLAKAPFRLFLQASECQHWNLLYEDVQNPTSTYDPYTDETHSQSDLEKWFDNTARHCQVGLELNLGKAVYIRLGYNYRQTKEMQTTSRVSSNFSGFAYGFEVKTKRFDIAFARNNYHLGQAPTTISLTMKL